MNELLYRIGYFLELVFRNADSFDIAKNNAFRDRVFMCLKNNIPQHPFLVPHLMASLVLTKLRPKACKILRYLARVIFPKRPIYAMAYCTGTDSLMKEPE